MKIEVVETSLDDMSIDMNYLEKCKKCDHDVDIARINGADFKPVYLVVDGIKVSEGVSLENDKTQLKFIGLPNDAFWSLYNKNYWILYQNGIHRIHSPYQFIYYQKQSI